MSNAEQALAAKIDQLLRETAGIYAIVRVSKGVVSLDGMVESEEQREAAEDILSLVPGIITIQNDLEVEAFTVSEDTTQSDDEILTDVTNQAAENDDSFDSDEEDEATEPDLNEWRQSLDTDLTTNTMLAVEEGVPYMPPTDPVVRPAIDPQDLNVGVGFGSSSIERFPSVESTTAFGSGPHGDEELRQQVVEALMTDAATADLQVHVSVRNGVVRLRGRVPTLTDAELAEEVASRVPTVREVREEFDIVDLD